MPATSLEPVMPGGRHMRRVVQVASMRAPTRAENSLPSARLAMKLLLLVIAAVLLSAPLAQAAGCNSQTVRARNMPHPFENPLFLGLRLPEAIN